jgi:hypothetical protein
VIASFVGSTDATSDQSTSVSSDRSPFVEEGAL